MEIHFAESPFQPAVAPSIVAWLGLGFEPGSRRSRSKKDDLKFVLALDIARSNCIDLHVGQHGCNEGTRELRSSRLQDRGRDCCTQSYQSRIRSRLDVETELTCEVIGLTLAYVRRFWSNRRFMVPSATTWQMKSSSVKGRS